MKWMGTNEYTGYIHAGISKTPEKNFELKLSYDRHYCQYFEKNESQWNLLLSDWLAKEIGRAAINVDGKTIIKNADLSKQLKVEIPAGLGTHNIQIRRK